MSGAAARAEALLELGRAGEAAALLREAIASDPEDAGLHARLAQALLGDRRPQEALAAAETAARLAPETSLLLLCTGTARSDVAVQEAAAVFAHDVRRVVLLSEDGATTSLRSNDSLGIAVLGALEHLPQLASVVMTL